MERILVLRGGALGDFIVTLPALALLRQRWPAARIELAGNATAAQLARHRGLLDAVHPQHEARWSTLYAPAELPRDFAAWLASFDLVFSAWPDPEGDLRRRFPVRDGQVYLTTPALPTRAPAAAHYAEPLQALGLTLTTPLFALAPPHKPARATGPIAIHPGSGSPRKNWPAERWLALLRELPGPVVVILGEAEVAAWTPRLAGLAVEVRVQPALEELVDLLAHTRLFLGHDSGVSHLAAACGAPSVLLFGPTDPVMWAPPAAHVTVLQQGSTLEALTLDDVRRAVAAAGVGRR
jgi:heptosyltransferase-3